MGKICLIRVDSRLIHGQVMTMWSKVNGINHILVIDDVVANDPFMKDVYLMAVPDTLGVTICSVEDAAERWKSNNLPDANLLVLIKDVHTAHRVWRAGFPIDSIQIGNLTPEKKTKILHPSSRLSEEHIPELLEMAEAGIDAYAQSVPTEKKIKIKSLV
ncbi:PTS sugar transporter subunit IIB [Clostridium polynesiense]|uniref:PTS sugar transporter subunit IIB n=1 Tax=Clostridium polynesiense TaxID=1325933 RepID=UPI00058BB95D|nr:PTS sugar transporter subunit IIB [Clostridium polynesiense]